MYIDLNIDRNRPRCTVARVNRTSTEITCGNRVIDFIDFPVDRYVVSADNEYIYSVNHSLFRKKMIRLSDSYTELITHSASCFTVDDLTHVIWWISSVTSELCSRVKCESRSNITECEQLDVKEGTFLITTKTGEIVVLDRQVEPTAETKGKFRTYTLVTFAVTITLTISFVVLFAGNGRSIRSSRGAYSPGTYNDDARSLSCQVGNQVY